MEIPAPKPRKSGRRTNVGAGGMAHPRRRFKDFFADFVSFLSQLRRWIKSTACSGAIGDMSGYPTSMIGLCQEGKSSPDALGGARV
jgi:hypothetical protein